ncbi:MAG: hypothetical protein MJZ37_00720 [Bacilli bacterium]|nr:hypothetical protein [Bacilli bacterium]
MSIPMFDNINYKGPLPDNARSQFNTLAEMKAYEEKYLPPMYEAFCLETQKKYRFNKSNDVDSKLGKWREESTGGGSSGGVEIKTVDSHPSSFDDQTIYKIRKTKEVYFDNPFEVFLRGFDDDVLPIIDENFQYLELFQSGYEGETLEETLRALCPLPSDSASISLVIDDNWYTLFCIGDYTTEDDGQLRRFIMEHWNENFSKYFVVDCGSEEVTIKEIPDISSITWTNVDGVDASDSLLAHCFMNEVKDIYVGDTKANKPSVKGFDSKYTYIGNFISPNGVTMMRDLIQNCIDNGLADTTERVLDDFSYHMEEWARNMDIWKCFRIEKSGMVYYFIPVMVDFAYVDKATIRCYGFDENFEKVWTYSNRSKSIDFVGMYEDLIVSDSWVNYEGTPFYNCFAMCGCECEAHVGNYELPISSFTCAQIDKWELNIKLNEINDILSDKINYDFIKNKAEAQNQLHFIDRLHICPKGEPVIETNYVKDLFLNEDLKKQVEESFLGYWEDLTKCYIIFIAYAIPETDYFNVKFNYKQLKEFKLIFEKDTNRLTLSCDVGEVDCTSWTWNYFNVFEVSYTEKYDLTNTIPYQIGMYGRYSKVDLFAGGYKIPLGAEEGVTCTDDEYIALKNADKLKPDTNYYVEGNGLQIMRNGKNYAAGGSPIPICDQTTPGVYTLKAVVAIDGSITYQWGPDTSVVISNSAPADTSAVWIKPQE